MVRPSYTNAGQPAKVVEVLKTPTNAGDSSRRGSLPRVREEHATPKTTIYEVDVSGVHVAKVGDGSETHAVSEPTPDASELTSVTLLTATGASNHPVVQKSGERGQSGRCWVGKTNPHQRWSACKGGGSFENSNQCWGFLKERVPSTSSERTCHPKNNHLRSGCLRGTCCKSWRRFGNTYCVRTYD